ncbi:hypothetical protein AB1Y20_018324 [Prymnesium parvum]|uniref:DNA 3'-5' helicase n=1 Tax=Prymnesium parvum TaxID=97485 RepID=A0AB34JRM9_PRYPA
MPSAFHHFGRPFSLPDGFTLPIDADSKSAMLKSTVERIERSADMVWARQHEASPEALFSRFDPRPPPLPAKPPPPNWGRSTVGAGPTPTGGGAGLANNPWGGMAPPPSAAAPGERPGGESAPGSGRCAAPPCGFSAFGGGGAEGHTCFRAGGCAAAPPGVPGGLNPPAGAEAIVGAEEATNVRAGAYINVGTQAYTNVGTQANVGAEEDTNAEVQEASNVEVEAYPNVGADTNVGVEIPTNPEEEGGASMRERMGFKARSELSSNVGTAEVGTNAGGSSGVVHPANSGSAFQGGQHYNPGNDGNGYNHAGNPHPGQPTRYCNRTMSEPGSNDSHSSQGSNGHQNSTYPIHGGMNDGMRVGSMGGQAFCGIPPTGGYCYAGRGADVHNCGTSTSSMPYADDQGAFDRPAPPTATPAPISGAERQAVLQKYDHNRFAWSAQLSELLHLIFGHREFRQNQLAICNAAIDGSDVFVIMPTGGGKSLCYQLPALVRGGVTVVICPLVSLIQDQVTQGNAMGIVTESLTSQQEPEQQSQVLGSLFRPQVIRSDAGIRLLYITPERLTASAGLKNALRALDKHGLLTRFVIDEAHCVSQWGHDFRPDYVNLSILKHNFPRVPLIALTATATERVRVDVMAVLGISGCPVFTQSFNRPNLWYHVKPKRKKVAEEIGATIRDRHRGQTGVIYCCSRRDCEEVAQHLKEQGLNAAFYHADIPRETRASVQQQWMDDKIHIICATIAFGMGINKPDVRFVIHHSLPKSLEGYMQETGRAGRDGDRADCYLFYTYGDKNKIDAMIHKSEGDEAGLCDVLPPPRHASDLIVASRAAPQVSKATQRQQLLQMVSYAEDEFECRRKLMLSYFNENFRPSHCGLTCDNCRSGVKAKPEDVSAVGIAALRLVEGSRARLTLAMVIDALKGVDSKVMKQKNLVYCEGFGAASHLKKTDIERTIKIMLANRFIGEFHELNDNWGGVNTYMCSGERAADLCSGNARLEVPMQVSTRPPRRSLEDETDPIESFGGLDGHEVGGVRLSKEQAELIHRLTQELIEMREAVKVQTQTTGASYIVYTNSTAAEIAKALPISEQQLRAVKGFGIHKAKRYGSHIFAKVRDFVSRHPALQPVLALREAEASTGKATPQPQPQAGWQGEVVDLDGAHNAPSPPAPSRFFEAAGSGKPAADVPTGTASKKKRLTVPLMFQSEASKNRPASGVPPVGGGATYSGSLFDDDLPDELLLGLDAPSAAIDAPPPAAAPPPHPPPAQPLPAQPPALDAMMQLMQQTMKEQMDMQRRAQEMHMPEGAADQSKLQVMKQIQQLAQMQQMLMQQAFGPASIS